MRKILAILVVFSLLCSNVTVAGLTSYSDDDITITFDKVLTEGGEITESGNYYLDSDLELSEPLVIPEGVTVNLNLNDHLLTNTEDSMSSSKYDGAVYTDSIIFVYGGTLNLYDTGTIARYWNDDSDTIKEGYSTEEGYDFTGGAITGGHNEKNLLGGGAVCVTNSGSFNMYSGNIVGNSTDQDGILGAGVYINTGSTFTMNGGSFIGNHCASNGGALYSKGTVVINDGLFSRNTSNGYSNYGGALYNAGVMTINGGTIQYNTALGGGAISNVGTLTMTGGTISNNSTSGSAGAILIGYGAVFNMSGGTISNNSTNGAGGAITLRQYGGVFNMSGGTITGNTSLGDGAGIYVSNGEFNVSGTASIIYNTKNESQNNVYLYGDYTITQTGTLTNTIGVTKFDGTGVVVVGGDYYSITTTDTEKYISDESYYRILEDNILVLKEEEIIPGTDVTETYQAEAFDIEELGLFDLEGLGDATYTVTPVTGEGTYNAVTKELTVTKVGTFKIEVETEHNVTAAPTSGTAIFTVEPKEVIITDLKAIERGPIEDNPYVDLDTTFGNISEIDGNQNYISAIVNDDDVSIYFDDAIAKIKDSDYDDDDTLNTEGTNNFTVEVTELSLTGEDSENYVIKTINDTKVTINMAIPYIAWPTATNIVYGDTENNKQLVGGKVIVKVPNEGYVDITANGSFQWVDANADIVNDVGEVTGTVMFLEDEDKIIEDTTYHTTLEEMTKDITYSVEAAPVEFNITDNIVEYDNAKTSQTPTVTAWCGDTKIDLDNYTLQYGKKETNGEVTIFDVGEEPNGVGTYYVYATLNSDNYRHAGTTVSTGKQIGAFTIYETGLTAESVSTYTVTFQYLNESPAYTQITGALEQDIHILPSLGDDSGYYAWETKSGDIYEFGSRMVQQGYDMTLTAVANPTTYSVTGTITGTDLDGTKDDELDDIAVILMQGSNLIASAVTNDDGEYSFDVEAGLYTIVVTRDQGVKNIVSSYLNVSGATVIDVELPDIRQNTVLNVAAGLMNITVENMDSVLEEGIKNTFTINITGIDILDEEATEYNAIMEVATSDGFTSDQLKEFFNITYTERPESEEIEFTYTDELLIYHIPLSGIYQGYEYYTIYRYNDGDIKTITTVPNANGEYMELAEDGQSIILYTKQADIYGIAFMENEVTVQAGTDVTETYQAGTLDISSLGMFDDVIDNKERTDGTYTVEPITGEGTLAEDNTSFEVTSVGTFEVTLEFPVADGYHREIYTAILTVTPKEVTIENLEAVSRKIIIDDYDVELSENVGDINGVVNGDDVTIDYSSYEATITEEEDYEDTSIYEDGKATFDVKVINLQLTGEDAKNYTLTSIGGTTVDITYEIPDIAWPTATNITYQDTELPILNGGKVVILDDQGIYTDITDTGSFQWVDDDGNIITDAEENGIGTKTGKVMFVETDTTASGGYHDILKEMVYEVSYKIEAAPVEFEITNNNIQYGDSINPTITAYYDGAVVPENEYNIMYVNSETGEIVSNLSEVGTYFIAAEFIKNDDGTYKYYHIGTLESTGKQIGVLNIYEEGDEPETYTVTFEGYPDLTIENANYQDIIILPDIGEDCIGWKTESGEVYDVNARFPQPAEDITLTLVASVEERTISGTVTGTDLNHYSDVKISNISVMLKSGGTIIATTTTDEMGYYEFDVTAGRYTLVFTRSQHGIENEETVFVDTTDNDVTVDIEFPDAAQKTVLEIDANLPGITVDGLDTLENTNGESYIYVSITASENTEDLISKALENGLTSDNLKVFFDISIMTGSTAEDTEYKTELEDGEMLTFYIPLSGIYQNKDEYQIYRYHDGEVDVITTEPNEDGEYIELIDDGKTLMLVASKFSDYGIAFISNDDEVVDPSIPSTDGEDTNNQADADSTTGSQSENDSDETTVELADEPDTGDNQNTNMIVIVGVIALLGTLALVVRKRRDY